MKRSRFSEEPIIAILKEHQAGLARRSCAAFGAFSNRSSGSIVANNGISDATFYKWRSKYGGMDVSDARRLKTLEPETAKLKKMLAEQLMDVATLKEMLGKNF